MSNSTLRLSKLDAASRQLETAITLYFQDGDPVSIHTLACAAREIIETLNSKTPGAPTIRQEIRESIKPTASKRFFAKLDAARNFFKHADRDPAGIIEFSRSASEFVILDACLTHKRLTRTTLPKPVLGTFLMWSVLTWAKDFVEFPGLDPNAPGASRLAGLSKAEFFAEMLPAALEAVATTDDAPDSSQG